MENGESNNGGLKNRRAVVTGASRGIGRSIAEALAASGSEVLVHYNTKEKQARLVVDAIHARHGKAWICQADLTDPDQVTRLFKSVEDKVGGP